MWDSVVSVKNPGDGVLEGQSWQAVQLVPLPVPFPVARQTTYKLEKIDRTETSNLAVISSSFELTDSKLSNLPAPYKGSFQMKGMFGFLQRYKYESLQGSGEQIFDIDRGVVIKEDQQYKLEITADFLLPLGDSRPKLTVEQKLSVELLGDQK